MNKVVLYNPKAVFFDMPLALLSIGSCLDPKEFEVVIIDARIEKDPIKRLLSHCDEALCLGVTALSGAPLKDALLATKAVKQSHPNLKVIWGGWHPSLFPEDLLKQEPSIDITVYGQGEETFKELAIALSGKSSLDEIRGIAFRKGNEIKKNPARLMANMDELAPVNYDLIDVEKYFELKGKRQFDYISSTGCFFRCSFCADPFVFKRKWSSISPDRMTNELNHWHEKYKFNDLNFQDETFFTYKKRSIEIAERLISFGSKFTWAATMRADQGVRLEENDFGLLKKSGLRRLLIGVESGSQEMMDWLQKDIKIEHVLECADRCKKHNISVIFPFIVGFPQETAKSVSDTLDFIVKLRTKSNHFQTPIFYFKPYPGSDITKNAIKNGFRIPQTLEEWTEFDFVDSIGGPWVDKAKFELIERFKFYSGLAWSSSKNPVIYPAKKLAALRCKRKFFNLPIEKVVAHSIRKRPSLS